MVKVFIIEDEPLIARDIKRIVQKNGYEVSGISYNSDQALDLLASLDYDIILLDIHLSGSRNGIELAHIINKKYPTPFIYITSFADRDTIQQVKLTMPSGYVVKPFNEKEVYSAIEIALYKNEQQPVKEMSLQGLNSHLEDTLTEREFEVVRGILDGLTNNQIAAHNFVSENTIKTHIKNIYTKLKTHSRAQLVTKVLSMIT